jgi:uncharacterized membrane protein
MTNLQIVEGMKMKETNCFIKYLIFQNSLQKGAKRHSFSEEKNLKFFYPKRIKNSVAERSKLAHEKSAKVFLIPRRCLWYLITIILALVATLTIFTIPENTNPLAFIRFFLGSIFVLFLPGYALSRALFQSRVHFKNSGQSLKKIERIALSIGMSIALASLAGLILNYTPWGIRLMPVTLSLLAFTLSVATVAVLNENRSARHEGNI